MASGRGCLKVASFTQTGKEPNWGLSTAAVGQSAAEHCSLVVWCLELVDLGRAVPPLKLAPDHHP